MAGKRDEHYLIHFISAGRKETYNCRDYKPSPLAGTFSTGKFEFSRTENSNEVASKGCMSGVGIIQKW
ncbi:MAG: hypothetical protein DI538_10600 [Azospira oryzae]|nr:MAG: hypothetical protein DI538_10600 [Azospira oryzae]